MSIMKLSITPLILAAALAALPGCGKKNGESQAARTQASEPAAAQAESVADAVKKAGIKMAEDAAKAIPNMEEIKKALAKIEELPASVSDITSGKYDSSKIKEAVEELKSVSLEKCPEDFRTAYAEVSSSLEKVSALAEKLPTKDMIKDKDALISSIKSTLSSDDAEKKFADLKAEIQNCWKDLNSSRAKLAEIAKKYVN